MALPGLSDLDEQRRTIDHFADRGYRQVLSLAIQATEEPGEIPQAADICCGAEAQI